MKRGSRTFFDATETSHEISKVVVEEGGGIALSCAIVCFVHVIYPLALCSWVLATPSGMV